MTEIEIEISPEVFLPAYRPLLTSDADIDMLWGGRDSGKSHFIAQKSIVDCLSADYFRMALIKKTYESIRDSQFKTLIEIIDDWKLSELFRSTKSPLEIHCINGNSFLARGCDNPQKIKSIRNPSHAWYEEADQLTEDDYITASTSLRSNKGRVKEYLSFNPEADGDYKKHWIYKQFLQDHANKMYGNFKAEKLIKIPGEKKPVKIRFTSTHTTYVDNPYCTPERQAKLEDLKDTNPYYYLVYTKGKWGVKQVQFPFLFNFDRARHVGSCSWNPDQITYLSFDFNKNPISCVVIQYYDDTIYVIDAIKIPNRGIDELCQVIAARYSGALFVVTGDYSGFNRSALISDDYNFYTAIQQNLDLNDNQIQVIRNPVITENQVLMNKILAKMKVIMDEENASALIFDCLFAEILPSGQLKKGDREDPAQQLDCLDGFRYFCNTIIRPLLN